MGRNDVIHRTHTGFLDFLNTLAKRMHIDESGKSSTKPLDLLLMKILTDVKEKVQTHRATKYPRSLK